MPPLREAEHIAIRGEGYSSADEAASAGERWKDIVCRALARLHLPADFGERRPHGQLTVAGEQVFSEESGHPVKAEAPGVTVYRCDPELRFIRSEAEVCRRPSPGQSAAVLVAAAELDLPMAPRERLAFDLYSGSFFQPSADARLLMLTMAVETLLVLHPRSADAQAHVQKLIDATAVADLDQSERDSLRGSLKWLREESIGQAGKRLAQTLEPRRYAGMTPHAFFTKCYAMRSQLVHGHVPRPDWSDVGLLAAQLEVFVGHLLSGALLRSFPD
ncbi:MAG: hypothetical protein KJ792_02400 [Actinobacteria bacterium]|nr:hypothetical protein [Actinomycetota bacterium]MCG2803581.1 hypothetical protein [Cellulomonas sp.]